MPFSYPYNFGTHYAVPGYMQQMLMRVEPFTKLAHKLQDGHFDVPDRLFSSLQAAYDNATEGQGSELPPQMYYSSEVFCNVNLLHFGVSQDQ